MNVRKNSRCIRGHLLTIKTVIVLKKKNSTGENKWRCKQCHADSERARYRIRKLSSSIEAVSP